MTDIYCYQSKAIVDTSSLFTFTQEEDGFRAANQHINVLYRNLNQHDFDKHYNEFLSYLNLDYQVVSSHKKITEEDLQIIEQKLITNWIRFYQLYLMPVVVKREDFVHPDTVNTVQNHLIKRKLSREEAIDTGAQILRMDRKEYHKTVEYWEWYAQMK